MSEESMTCKTRSAKEAAKSGGEDLHDYKCGVWDGINATPEPSQIESGYYRGGYAEGFYTRYGQKQEKNSKTLAFRLGRPRIEKRREKSWKKTDATELKDYRPPIMRVRDNLEEAKKNANMIPLASDKEDILECIELALQVRDSVERERKERWAKSTKERVKKNDVNEGLDS